jgi:hypothetical protein
MLPRPTESWEAKVGKGIQRLATGIDTKAKDRLYLIDK